MNKYIFQTGGEQDNADFFNQYADAVISARDQQTVDNEQTMEQTQPEDSDFIKGLYATAEEDNTKTDADLLESFNQKIETLQNQLKFQEDDMQQQLASYAMLSSDDGQNYFTSMYDTNDDSVPFTMQNSFPTLDKAYFNSAGEQGLTNIGQKGLEIGNTVAGMLGYKPTFNSVYRDPKQQAAYVKSGVGVPNSYHLSGNAIDMKPQDWANLTASQQAELKSKYDVVYHNNHYHIEPK